MQLRVVDRAAFRAMRFARNDGLQQTRRSYAWLPDVPLGASLRGVCA